MRAQRSMQRDEPMATGPMVSDQLARVGAVLGMVIGAGLFLYAVYTFLPPASPRTYSITMLVGGTLECVVCYFALYKNRAAWAFALSLNGVAAVVFLFGATKVRDATDLPLAVAMLPCVAFGLTTVLLTIASEEYKD